MKSSYTGLWLLLSAALAIILIISFSDDLSIGNYTLKKAPFQESLLADKAAELKELAERDSILQANREEAERKEKEAKVDSTSHSILLIGDSMTFNIALRMAQYAKANGHTFHSVNWDSSGTVKWGKSTHLADYIKEYGATYV
ncbi:MAG: hypothetical protein K2J15_06885, partial [Muribaculaceae bacterium]|nr:hypothetical protein [Muribaculaceae bacterium]